MARGTWGQELFPSSASSYAPQALFVLNGEKAPISPRRLQKRAEGTSREVCRWIPGWAANVGGCLRGGNTAWLPKPRSLSETRRHSEISQALSILQSLHLIKKKTNKPQTKKPEHLVKSSFLGEGFLSPGGPGPSPRSWDAAEGTWSHRAPTPPVSCIRPLFLCLIVAADRQDTKNHLGPNKSMWYKAFCQYRSPRLSQICAEIILRLSKV